MVAESRVQSKDFGGKHDYMHAQRGNFWLITGSKISKISGYMYLQNVCTILGDLQINKAHAVLPLH